MKNDCNIINEIIGKIEEKACYANPGPTAVASADFIDEHFMLIRRTNLPEVTLDVNERGQLKHINEFASRGNTKVMREIAYDYLAMADFLDSKKDREAERILQRQQFEAYKTMYPTTECTAEDFKLSEVTSSPARRAIEEIVKLRAQLAK